MKSDNLQLPCVQPPTSSYNPQLPHGRHGRHGCNGHLGCHGHYGRRGHDSHIGHGACSWWNGERVVMVDILGKV